MSSPSQPYPQQQYPPQQGYAPPPYQPQYQQPMPPPAAPKSKTGLIVAVVVIAIIVVIAVVAFAIMSMSASHATLKVRVSSIHFLETITYQVYIDGSLKNEGTLSPLAYVEYTYDLYPGSSCKTYNVFASSTGGALGPTSDSENIELCSGTTQSVNLTV